MEYKIQSIYEDKFEKEYKDNIIKFIKYRLEPNCLGEYSANNQSKYVVV